MRIIGQCDDGPGTKSAGALRRPAWSVINYVCQDHCGGRWELGSGGRCVIIFSHFMARLCEIIS